MTIPTASNYPESFDSDTNLYLVHDALRLTLAVDYNPGDTSITVVGDDEVMDKFPTTGIITLTEQCSDIDKRAISFYYNAKVSDDTIKQFTGLEKLPAFEDVIKPKDLTHVTLNVMAAHHNNLKDALIAIEKFMGVKGTIDLEPLGDTLTGRLNFLLRLVFSPKAWFQITTPSVGLIDEEEGLLIEFRERSFRLGPGDLEFVWNFGETCASTISTVQIISITDPSISVISVDTANIVSIYDYTNDWPSTDYIHKRIVKKYTCPGIWNVSLKAKNQYNENTVEFVDAVNPRIQAPGEAVISITPAGEQYFITSPDPPEGPYTTTPVLRAATNNFISIEVIDEVIAGSDPLRSEAGEWLDPVTESPIDPIDEYIWSLGDDLDHARTSATKGLYSIGGIYDLKLRVNTEHGGYRITTYENALDIVESRNLWLYTFNSPTVTANEFGLISETFKTCSGTLAIERNDDFLTGSNNEDQAKREFNRNVAFSAKTLRESGERGIAMMYYAQGGFDPDVDQSIRVIGYEGFRETYYLSHSSPTRYWNWLCLSSPTTSYFLFGSFPQSSILPETNPSNQAKGVYDKLDLTYDDSYTLQVGTDYANGADELRNHVTSAYNPYGPENGYFAVYRSCWKDSSGYFVRNDGVDPYFKIKSFYKTEGTVGEEFQFIKKLPDMAGPAKLEGQLVALTNGVFFFNNSGNISAYNTSTGSWETGAPTLSALAFRQVQDTSVLGFDRQENTLLASSDGDRIAYLSFDYSPNAFIKFNGQDITFTNIGARPTGEQFVMGIY